MSRYLKHQKQITESKIYAEDYVGKADRIKLDFRNCVLERNILMRTSVGKSRV